jgi:hypothetical protein
MQVIVWNEKTPSLEATGESRMLILAKIEWINNQNNQRSAKYQEVSRIRCAIFSEDPMAKID